MANSNNVYGTAQPLQGNVSDWVDGQEKMDFAYRAEQRGIAKLAQDKKDKEQQRLEKWKSEIKIPEFDATGVRKTDQIQSELLLNLKDKIFDITKKIVPGMPYQEEAKLRAELEMINNAPRQLKLGTESYTKEIQNIQKQLNEGKIVLTPKQMKMMDGFAQGRLSLDWNDGQIIVGMFDGDGKVSEAMSLDKLINGETFGELVPKMDFAGAFQKAGKDLGYSKTQTDSNFVKNTKKETPIEFAKLTARGMLYTDNGGYTPLAKSELYNMGIYDFENVPQDKLDLMEKKAVEIQLANRDKENVTDVDYSARNTAIKNAQDKNKEKDENKPTISYIEQVSNPSPSLADDFSFSTPYQLKDKKTGMGKDGFISGITTDKSGRIILKGEEKYGKRKGKEGDVETTEDIWKNITITDKQEVQSIIGGVLGTNSYKESLKVLDDIKSKNSSGQGNNKQSESTGKPKIDY